jgi:predicted nucleotide-binding protein (sugar kinase/HSP70/actin superfamily)
MSQKCSLYKESPQRGDLDYLHQPTHQWQEKPSVCIAYLPKEQTVFLSGGLTLLQDSFIASALNGMGISFIALPNPNFKAFQTGKAFGNRGQCNPTYFTVGNLVQYLQNLRDTEGLSSEEIVKKYVYITAGGCGPCRFGMYITEYKKALRDAGFEGFRITSFDHEKGIFQGDVTKESLIDYTPRFFLRLIQAVLIGDILNILGYQMRPYEKNVGDTNHALEACKEHINHAFLKRTSLLKALWKCRKILEDVPLNRLQVKPKVMVMGEFWAAMTEGDGNYHLHRFLESEGAECIPQPILNRLLLSLWEAKTSAKENAQLQGREGISFQPLYDAIRFRLGERAIKGYFTLYAKIVGLHHYPLPNIDYLASLAKEYYTLECSGGEGHLEVAHLLESIHHNIAHLVISVKPFGCMPSSAVSDGIQTRITNDYPQANFLSIETSGEGAANFYSRVQMALFKAKQSAKEEFERLSPPREIPPKVHHYRYQPNNGYCGRASTLLASLQEK